VSRSETESLTRAALLCDPGLVDLGFGEDPARALSMRVMTLGTLDETVVQRRVAGLLDEQGQVKPTLLEELDWLCGAMAELHDGLARLGPGFLPRRLARLVAPDQLFLFHAEIDLPPSETFAWPAIPILDTGEIAGLFRGESLETHIHLGGTLPPLFYWCPLIAGWLPHDCLRDVPSPQRGHASFETWQQRIGDATWLRLRLAAELEERQLREGHPRFFPWLPPDALSRLGLVDRNRPPGNPEEARDLALELALQHPSSDADFSGESRRDTTWQDWPWVDPLRPPMRSAVRTHYAAGERRLLYAAARQIRQEQAGRTDRLPFFAQRLREYLCIHNAFHRLLVFDLGHAGLGRFVETFDRRWRLAPRGGRVPRRQKRLRRILALFEQARMEAALESQLLDPYESGTSWQVGRQGTLPARRLEIRVSVPRLPEMPRTLNAWLKAILLHLEPRGRDLAIRNSQIGLIFHFIKVRLPEAEARQAATEAAERLTYLLEEYPWLRPFVVGIDAAGFERNSHPRIFAPAYSQLFEYGRRHRPRSGEPPIRLGGTFHVGEDFEDILTGLRHLDETRALLLPRCGGRLGHALVLAERPEGYYARRGCSEPPLGIHLLDLVWAWGTMSSLGFTNKDAAFFVPVIEQWLAAACPGAMSNLTNCWQAMGLSGSNPRGQVALEVELLSVLGAANAGLDLDQPRPVPVESRSWLQLLEHIQQTLRSRVAQAGICVEANPSSNLLIGRYSGYSELPCLALVGDQIPVSLNTDDPGLFMTCLPGEFAAMYQALGSTMSHRARLDWLRARLTDALDHSFLGAHVPAGYAAFHLACRALRPPRYGYGEAWRLRS
jgi:hypothetical protein